MTCIGNSGPLPTEVSDAIEKVASSDGIGRSDTLTSTVKPLYAGIC